MLLSQGKLQNRDCVSREYFSLRERAWFYGLCREMQLGEPFVLEALVERLRVCFDFELERESLYATAVGSKIDEANIGRGEGA